MGKDKIFETMINNIDRRNKLLPISKKKVIFDDNIGRDMSPN